MNCIKCNIRDICTIYEAVNKAISVAKGLAKIDVSECQVCPNFPQQYDLAQTGQPYQVVSQTAMPSQPAIRRDFKEESVKKQKELEAKEKMVNKIKVTQDNSERIIKIYPKCPTCGGTTTEDDINACSGGCGKLICSNCGTEDPTNSERFCQECWDAR